MFAYGTLRVGSASFSANLKLLYFLDDVIDRGRLGRIAHVVAPWDSTVCHIAGHSLFVRLQVGRATMRRPVVGWRLDVVVGIPVGEMTGEALDVVGFDGQKLITSEEGGDVVLLAEPVDEFHKSTDFGMIPELERHDPAGTIIVDVKLGNFILKRKCQKRNIKKKRN